MESSVLQKTRPQKSKPKLPTPDRFLLIRWLIIIGISFAIIGYGRLLPTLFSDLFVNFGAYGKFLGRFSFLSMVFLQVLYVFAVDPEISGRERGPKGDRVYQLFYVGITLLPFVTTFLFGLLAPVLTLLTTYFSTLTVLYLVALLPAILLLELLVRWRLRG